MRIQQENNSVRIIAKGTELIRIRTLLNNVLDGVAKKTEDGLIVPLACWDIISSQIPEFKKCFSDQDSIYSLHSKARSVALSSLAQNNISNITDIWNDILDLPQQFAVNAMTTPNLLGLCLFDEQGSGKTVMTISAFDILRGNNEIDAMIVVCPKSMILEWGKDIKKFLQDKYSVSIADGNSEKRREIALSKFDILVSNYEGLSPMRIVLNAKASKLRFLLVVDESYYAKNENASRSQVVKEIRNFCQRCFVLCGTPAPNSPYDLINQFNLADLGYTFSTFKQTNNLDSDKSKIKGLLSSRGTYIRRQKEEILDFVPNKNFHLVKVDLPSEQRDMYERARSSLELELRTYDNKTFKKNLRSYYQKRSALLQICVTPGHIDHSFTKTPAKYIELDKLVNRLIEEQRKVIIWTFYKASINDLLTRYEQYEPLVIDGETSSEERKNAVEVFQNDTSRFLFIGNPSAAGAGITLHASYDAIYLSYTNQAAHYLQSLDRIHRRGQKATSVNYYLLVCSNTIEEFEVMRLRARELQQHELLGDTISWPSSLDDALAELSSNRNST